MVTTLVIYGSRDERRGLSSSHFGASLVEANARLHSVKRAGD
jgi:hypothetical protein